MYFISPHKRSAYLVFYRTLVGAFLLSFLAPDGVARGKTKPRQTSTIATTVHVYDGLVEQKAKFDTSLAQVPFNLGVKQDVLRSSERKNLLHQKAKLAVLKASSDKFYVKAAIDDALLKAQTGRTAKPSHPLEGAVDKTERPQVVLVSETPRSPLFTLEHNVHAPFRVDLRKVVTSVAPDVVSTMDFEISRTPARSAENVARLVKEMEDQLNARLPHPDMPTIPSKITASASLSQALEIESKRVTAAEREASHSAAENLKNELQKKTEMQGEGQKLTGLKVASVGQLQFPKFPNLPKFPAVPFLSLSNSATSASQRNTTDQAEREMDAQMARVNKQVPSSSNLDAVMHNAKEHSRTVAAVSQPGMDVILTHVRSLSVTALPKATDGNPHVQVDVDDVIEWDAWHKQFATLARGPILTNVSKAKNPSGANSVQITIRRDQSIEVVLLKPSNPAFDVAIVNAYQTLRGNSALKFPGHSRRESITFIVDNEHNARGAPTGVESQTSTGDKEVLRHQL